MCTMHVDGLSHRGEARDGTIPMSLEEEINNNPSASHEVSDYRRPMDIRSWNQSIIASIPFHYQNN